MAKALKTLWILGLLLCAGGNVAAAEAPAADQLDEGLVNPGYHEPPDWFKQSFLDIREDVSEATDGNKRVVLYFYQDGCPYCKKLLETNFGLREITGKTREHFDVVAINMWGDREVTDFNGNFTTEKDFAADLKVMFTPTLLFLDESGNVVVRLNGFYAPHKFEVVLDYVSGREEQRLSLRDYYKEINPAPAEGKLHHAPGYLQAPYNLAVRKSGKPLLVLFEQKDCAVCDELHLDMLKRKESQEQLERFDVVLLDMWSKQELIRPDGKVTSASKWAKDLEVQYAPTMVMFDANGQEAFRSEAYLRSFHVQSVLDYVASGAYREQPNFQRFIAARADALEARGIHVDLMD